VLKTGNTTPQRVIAMSSGRGLSADPNDRMGVFKQLSDVPDRYRLHQHATAFQDRDVWDEYTTEGYWPQYPDPSEQLRESVERAGRYWKEHMESRGRHHALATPEDVESWTEQLLDRVTVETAYSEYWNRIEGLYTWLQTRTDYPHVYHPVWMAVANYPHSKTVWNHKLGRGNRTGGIWNE
jgi:hypothetical protein